MENNELIDKAQEIYDFYNWINSKIISSIESEKGLMPNSDYIKNAKSCVKEIEEFHKSLDYESKKSYESIPEIRVPEYKRHKCIYAASKKLEKLNKFIEELEEVKSCEAHV